MSALLDALRVAIRQIVREEIELALAETTEPAEWLTTREAAEFARVSQGTLRRWRREGRLRAEGAGNRLRWRRSDVEKMMRDDGKRQAPRVAPRSRPARALTPEEQVAQMGYA